MSRLRSVLALHLLADYFPPLHGLRAIAIVSVLQVHVSLTLRLIGFLPEEHPLFRWSTNVWFGMDLFFVLSGFLIGTLLLPSEGRPPDGMGRFYVRRAFRIVPLYYVVLTVLAAISQLPAPALAAQRSSLWYEYAYLTNYAPFTVPPVMPWAWSLCVEEHFYLAVPILAALLARLPRSSLRIGALGALWLLGLAIRYAVFASRPSWTANEMTLELYTRTHTRFDVLVAGVLLAHVQREHGARIRELLRGALPRRALAAVPALACAALLGPLARRQDVGTVLAWGTVTSVMYVSLVLLLLNTDGWPSRFLSSRGFLRFATLGYGVYLVHPPVITYVIAPVAAFLLLEQRLPLGAVWAIAVLALVLVATAVAFALHVAVEKPALWLRDHVARCV